MNALHLVNIFKHHDPREQARLARAESTWQPSYGSFMLPCLVPTGSLPRNTAEELGDPRQLPYFKDLVEYAEGLLPSELNPIFVVTNADSCLPSDIAAQIEVVFQAREERMIYSHRRNFTRFPKKHLTVGEINSRGDTYTGIDLVAFDLVWWERNKAKYPDFVLGCEGWDWTFKFWPGAQRIVDCVYHEYHYPPFWMANRHCPAELWNKARALDWFRVQPNPLEILRDWPTLEEYVDHLEAAAPSVRAKMEYTPIDLGLLR